MASTTPSLIRLPGRSGSTSVRVGEPAAFGIELVEAALQTGKEAAISCGQQESDLLGRIPTSPITALPDRSGEPSAS